MQNSMRRLSWAEFDQAIEWITDRYVDHSFTGVYGVPRGGLCLGLALSHSLHIPLLMEPKEGCLVVDDVYETGQTLTAVRDQVNSICVVWVSKSPPTWWDAATTVVSEEWLLFPWENAELAGADEREYQSSRSIKKLNLL